MKKVIFLVLAIVGLVNAMELNKVDFDTYLSKFDYKERNEMKIKTPDMLALVEEGKAVLVDISFAKEFEGWNIAGSVNINLNEIQKRLNELPKDKLIITACPHNDRSNMARVYLTLNGYQAKYLNDGLLKAADFLRGENAKEYMDELKKNKEKK